MENKTLPKIIHQIWSGISEPLPPYFKVLGETWKRDYPDWEYILWDNQMMNDFIQEHYPQHIEIYNKFPYNVQRWDAIRYLILQKMGGMYVDFDYESVKSIDQLIENKCCCFAAEPLSHADKYPKKVDKVFNNALMLCVPDHPFMKKVIQKVFSEKTLHFNADKEECVLHTTGPWMLMDLYYQLSEADKEEIYLIPAANVTPFDFFQARRFLRNIKNRDMELFKELEPLLDQAYAIHYFFSGWRKDGE